MKTLQNDLTSIEQSKRLLKLGVPKNSANHYYGKDGKLHYIDGKIPYSLLWETGCTPCWSAGRLIEIYNMCVDFDLDDGAAIVIFIQDKSPIAQMMQMFEDKVGIMAFSNLDD